MSSKKGVPKEKGGVKDVQASAERALASFNALFERPAADGSLELGDFDNKPFLRQLKAAFVSLADDLEDLRDDESTARRLVRLESLEADSVDQLNALAAQCRSKSFQALLEPCVFEAVTLGAGASPDSPAAIYLLRHARVLAETLSTLIPDYAMLLASLCEEKGEPRLSPLAFELLVKDSVFSHEPGPETARELARRAAMADPFNAGRAFRHVEGEFVAVELSSIRKVEGFYGYAEARRRFMDCFKAFSEGRSNLPILITSLPGLGKTHFSISHALHFPNLTLVLPEPGDLERPLEKLIRRLASRPERRFVLFFDDVDTRRIDWYFFRTNVGGSFSLPPNVTIAIASNYQFPANISSRGVGLSFQMFDEVRCQEMVRDFLMSLGMRHPPPELVSVIAADYVEEFGQKFFEELSPRTLVRYLDRYQKDAAKRVRMLDLSKGDVTAKPDSQVFFETNVKLLKSLYGDDAIEELRKRQLDGAK